MRTSFVAFVTLAVTCTTPVTALAQRAAPAAVTREWAPPATSAEQLDVVGVTNPRPRVVAPLAFVFGVAGGVAGYYAAEESCARGSGECYDHFLAVPLGYTMGVSLGAGIAGTAEGCRTASLRALGGAVLGFVAGAVVAGGVQPLGIVSLPAGPVVGATWLVARCRMTAREDGSMGSG